MINKTTEQHYTKYFELAKQVSDEDKNYLKLALYSKIGKDHKGRKELILLTDLFLKDQYLNNIPMRFWDNLSGAIVDWKGNINWFNSVIKFPPHLSLSERVSILKHITIYQIVGATPEYE